MPELNKKEQRRFPPWLRVSCKGGRVRTHVRHMLTDLGLHTVCESANCPNLCECWERGTATFMILGDACTRDCAFCAVQHADKPEAPDPGEPDRVATAASELGLDYVVVTSVTRDDLSDGGAGQFSATIHALQAGLPGAGIEVLTPDFGGNMQAVGMVLQAGPTVFNHNLETCRRLAVQVRPQADYDRSLRVLHHAADHCAEATMIKSGAMLGLGETDREIHEMLSDLRRNEVQILTLGQYLPPSADHWPLDRYITPDDFAAWKEIAEREYGFAHAVSGPLVRSSYHAEEAVGKATDHRS